MQGKHTGCMNNATLYYIQNMREVALGLAFIVMLMIFYITPIPVLLVLKHLKILNYGSDIHKTISSKSQES